jgi:hypothetical protein
VTLKKYVLSGIKLKNVKKVTFYELVNMTILEAKYVVRYCWPTIHRPCDLLELYLTDFFTIHCAPLELTPMSIAHSLFLTRASGGSTDIAPLALST